MYKYLKKQKTLEPVYTHVNVIKLLISYDVVTNRKTENRATTTCFLPNKPYFHWSGTVQVDSLLVEFLLRSVSGAVSRERRLLHKQTSQKLSLY